MFQLDPQLGSGRASVTLKGLPGGRDSSALKPGDERLRSFHAFGHFLLRQARFRASSNQGPCQIKLGLKRSIFVPVFGRVDVRFGGVLCGSENLHLLFEPTRQALLLLFQIIV